MSPSDAVLPLSALVCQEVVANWLLHAQSPPEFPGCYPPMQTLKRRTVDGQKLEAPLAAQDISGAQCCWAPAFWPLLRGIVRHVHSC